MTATVVEWTCPCARPLEAHKTHPCHGGIVCGGYVPHGCAIKGCMEPEYGVHGPECQGVLVEMEDACWGPE